MQPVSAFKQTREIEQHDHNQREQHERIQEAAVVLPVRCDIGETVYERSDYKQDEIKQPKAKHDSKESAPGYVFFAEVQQNNRQQWEWYREKQGFQQQHDFDRRNRDGEIIEEHIYKAY